VYDLRRDSLQAQGKWRLDQVWVYPLPENTGLTLDVDQGNQVQAIVKDSPVDRAGLQVGDLLRSINGVPTASIADVQYGLHRAPAEGEIPIVWLRDGQPMSARINVTKGWRKTDISWRWSLPGLEPIPWVQGEDLGAKEKRGLGLNEKQLAFYQGAFLFDPARLAGIRVHDILVGIDNQKLEMTARQFQAFMRLNYKVGDRVTYNILRDGQRLDLPLTLVARPSR
jgi:S1-C subfamily serine protease